VKRRMKNLHHFLLDHLVSDESRDEHGLDHSFQKDLREIQRWALHTLSTFNVMGSSDKRHLLNISKPFRIRNSPFRHSRG
jgi:hypothetical protein